VGGLVDDLLVAGEDDRERAHVAGALDVVLATQRVHAGAGLAQVAEEHLDVRHRLDVVDTGGVLGDAHRVEDRTGLRSAEPFGGLLEALDRDTGDLRDVLKAVSVLHDDFLEFLVVLRALRDELLVLPAVLDDLLHQAVQDSNVAAGDERHVEIGLAGGCGVARVGVDDLCTVLLRLDNLAADERVLLEGVGAEDEEALRFGDVEDRVGHRTRAEGARKTGDGGRVAEPGAVVDVPGLHDAAGELHHQVVLFVRDPGRCERGKLVGLVGLELLCDQVVSLVPGRLDELAVLLDERLRQAVGAVHELVGVGALRADLPLVDRGAAVRCCADNLPVLDDKVKTTACSAVGTRCSYILQRHVFTTPLW
jgi:hypothetical protein